MATAQNSLGITYDDLLAAINPPKKTPVELYELALDYIAADWRAGRITDDEAESMLQELMTARVHYEIQRMVKDTFSPDFSKHSGKAPRRRFSLL